MDTCPKLHGHRDIPESGTRPDAKACALMKDDGTTMVSDGLAVLPVGCAARPRARGAEGGCAPMCAPLFEVYLYSNFQTRNA